ncbi:hypothetical protein QJS10_CPB18g02102 [Acorus calamus]|uniref:Uncharacterized protein n=1 Tax=Acorus calamus TaxID=4465 RepID=A0AAV9CQL1_ACOCL|nr:hypothetical protein QJS10_CPB18g02102 [Acorus calamus]
MELYKYAQDIFLQQKQHLTQMAEVEPQMNTGSNTFWFSPWKALMIVIVLLFLFLIIFIVNTRKKMSKLKV